MVTVLVSPMYAYAMSNIGLGIMYAVSGVILIVAAVCAFCSPMRPKCGLATFWLLMAGQGILMSCAYTNWGIFAAYAPNIKHTACADRFASVPELRYLGDPTFTAKLCSTDCPCNYSRDNVITANVDTSSGASKIQDCTNVWRD